MSPKTATKKKITLKSDENQQKSASKARKQKLVFPSDSETENLEENLVPGTSAGPRSNLDSDGVYLPENVLTEMLKEHQKNLADLVSKQIENAISKSEDKILNIVQNQNNVRNEQTVFSSSSLDIDDGARDQTCPGAPFANRSRNNILLSTLLQNFRQVLKRGLHQQSQRYLIHEP